MHAKPYWSCVTSPPPSKAAGSFLPSFLAGTWDTDLPTWEGMSQREQMGTVGLRHVFPEVAQVCCYPGMPVKEQQNGEWASSPQ